MTDSDQTILPAQDGAIGIDAYRDKPAGYFTDARTEIEPLLPPATPRVLEIGCGSGTTMAWLRTIRPITYAEGVELMPGPGEKARAEFDRVTIGSLEAPGILPAGQMFDLILALDVLEHLSDAVAMVNRLMDHLAPGGTIIASLPNVAHMAVSWDLFWRGRWRYTDAGILDRTHLQFFDEYTARALFTQAGLTVAQLVRKVELPMLNRFGLYRRNEWLRWQVRKVAARALPAHLQTWQFLIRADRPA